MLEEELNEMMKDTMEKMTTPPPELVAFVAETTNLSPDNEADYKVMRLMRALSHAEDLPAPVCFMFLKAALHDIFDVKVTVDSKGLEEAYENNKPGSIQ